MEVEVASIDVEVFRHASARQQLTFEGPVVSTTAEEELPDRRPQERGPEPTLRQAVKENMLREVKAGRLPPKDLEAMKLKQLVGYGGGKTTASDARQDALAELALNTDSVPPTPGPLAAPPPPLPPPAVLPPPELVLETPVNPAKTPENSGKTPENRGSRRRNSGKTPAK